PPWPIRPDRSARDPGSTTGPASRTFSTRRGLAPPAAAGRERRRNDQGARRTRWFGRGPVRGRWEGRGSVATPGRLCVAPGREGLGGGAEIVLVVWRRVDRDADARQTRA